MDALLIARIEFDTKTSAQLQHVPWCKICGGIMLRGAQHMLDHVLNFGMLQCIV